jgi:hypothetical protein
LVGDIRDAPQDQNNDGQEDEDGKITEQAKQLKTLNQYKQDILRLQDKKEHLLKQAITRNRAKQTQRAIRQAKIQRNKLAEEVLGLKAAGPSGAICISKNIMTPGDDLCDKGEGAYDPASPLSKESQLYPWSPGYKPRIPIYEESQTQGSSW